MKQSFMVLQSRGGWNNVRILCDTREEAVALAIRWRKSQYDTRVRFNVYELVDRDPRHNKAEPKS